MIQITKAPKATDDAYEQQVLSLLSEILAELKALREITERWMD